MEMNTQSDSRLRKGSGCWMAAECSMDCTKYEYKNEEWGESIAGFTNLEG